VTVVGAGNLAASFFSLSFFLSLSLSLSLSHLFFTFLILLLFGRIIARVYPITSLRPFSTRTTAVQLSFRHQRGRSLTVRRAGGTCRGSLPRDNKKPPATFPCVCRVDPVVTPGSKLVLPSPSETCHRLRGSERSITSGKFLSSLRVNRAMHNGVTGCHL